MPLFSKEKPTNMTLLEKYYINKNEKTNEVLNGSYISCRKDDQGVVKLYDVDDFDANLVTLDRLKRVLGEEKFNQTDYVYVKRLLVEHTNNGDKFTGWYKDKYFIHTTLDKNGKRMVTFIDEPLKSIKTDPKKKKIIFTFTKKKIEIQATSFNGSKNGMLTQLDKMYEIIDKDKELEQRFLALSNFFVERESKLKGLYIVVYGTVDDLKYFMIKYDTDAKGDIIDIKKKTILNDEYIKNIIDNKIIGNPNGDRVNFIKVKPKITVNEVQAKVKAKEKSNGMIFMESTYLNNASWKGQAKRLNFLRDIKDINDYNFKQKYENKYNNYYEVDDLNNNLPNNNNENNKSKNGNNKSKNGNNKSKNAVRINNNEGNNTKQKKPGVFSSLFGKKKNNGTVNTKNQKKSWFSSPFGKKKNNKKVNGTTPNGTTPNGATPNKVVNNKTQKKSGMFSSLFGKKKNNGTVNTKNQKKSGMFSSLFGKKKNNKKPQANGTIPSNGAVPPNGTIPPNGAVPPNGTVPPNGVVPSNGTLGNNKNKPQISERRYFS